MATLFAPRFHFAGSLFLLVAGVSILGAASARADQSLADVAKRSEDHRKADSAKPRVYTNTDLGAPPAGSAPAAPGDATAAKPADTAADAKKPADKKPDDPAAKDEAYWSGRLKALTAQVERDTTFADALQTKVNSLSTDFVNRDDPAQRATLARERQKSMAQLAALQKDIAAGKKAIADLREEARRAGVPAGWLR
jgi:hypothetical protein